MLIKQIITNILNENTNKTHSTYNITFLYNK